MTRAVWCLLQVWATYMPVKNSPAEARGKAQLDAPTHSATHAEFSVYDAWGRLLRSAGAAVATGAHATFNGLDVTMCPCISFSPSFVCSLSEMRVWPRVDVQQHPVATLPRASHGAPWCVGAAPGGGCA